MRVCAFVAIAILLPFAPQAFAIDLYKCVDAKGTTIYQQDPCPTGTKKTAVRYVAPEADDTTHSYAAQAKARRKERAMQALYGSTYATPPSSGPNNYDRDQAQRSADIEKAQKDYAPRSNPSAATSIRIK